MPSLKLALKNSSSDLNIMREFKLNEISIVDRPAQALATATIMKRNADKPYKEAEKEEDKTEKIDSTETLLAKNFMVLTSSIDGHQHAIDMTRLIEREGNSVDSSYAESDDDDDFGHSHTLVIDEKGVPTLSENNGHTHEIDMEMFETVMNAINMRRIMEEGVAMSQNGMLNSVDGPNVGKASSSEPVNKDGTMTKENKDSATSETAIADLEKRLADSEAALAVSKAEASFNDDQRNFYSKLDDDAKKSFRDLDNDGRNAEIEKANASKKVIYKSRDGIEFTNEHDPIIVAMAKRVDAAEKRADDAEAKASDSDLEKRAAEFNHLPGGPEAVKPLLKAIDAIPDEKQRDASIAALKSQNAALKPAFDTLGSTTLQTPVEGSITKQAEDKLDELTKAYAAKHSVSEPVAMAAVLKTAEGQGLYAKMYS